MARVVIVWDQSFLGYDLGASHPLNPVRLDLTIRLSRELGVLDRVSLVVPESAPDEEIERVHRPSYLEAVKFAPKVRFGTKYGLGTPDNPIFPRMHEASALVCGGSLAAARAIVEGRADRGVNIAGGLHHAMASRASGFCVYNDCAVAISWLLDHGVHRVAYLDVDVHHGDGVQAAFYDDARVLTVSLHQHPATLFPGTGWPGELGKGEGEGYAVNVPLPPGTGDAEWLRAFHAVVPPLLRSFQPQVLVTQCGADTHREDPLAELALSVDGHRTIYAVLRDAAERHAGGRWLALGGGGYQLFRVVPRSWTHLLATVLDRDVDPARELPAGWLSHTATLTRQALPSSMTDGVQVSHLPWRGEADHPVDRAILETRRAVFPLHGLDPDDPGD